MWGYDTHDIHFGTSSGIVTAAIYSSTNSAIYSKCSQYSNRSYLSIINYQLSIDYPLTVPPIDSYDFTYSGSPKYEIIPPILAFASIFSKACTEA